MERYQVTVQPSEGRPLPLLIPFSPSSLVSELQKEITRRAKRHGVWAEGEDMVLYFNDIHGPILDGEDILSDVLQDPRTERILGAYKKRDQDQTSTESNSQGSPESHTNDNEGTFKVRVITPTLSQLHRDLESIATLPSSMHGNTTLRSMKAAIAKYLGWSNPKKVFDLHMAGVPLMTQSLDATVDEIGLTKVLTCGVLDVYVVERSISNDTQPPAVGKDAIFSYRDHWQLPEPQSDRGTAIFLSSLRVFSDLTGTKSMDQQAQDSLLRALHLLTNFPPAVRTLFILMSGKTPKPIECAALSHALYEAFKGRIVAQSISSDPERVLEMSRLVLGLLLEKAEQTKVRSDEGLPYLKSMKGIDTQGTDGISSEMVTLTKLVSSLCGEHSEIVMFDMAILSSPEDPIAGGCAELFKPQEIKDLNYLANICERNGLFVVHPSGLFKSKVPALSLDKDGLLAVYTGSNPCADPGMDKTIFRPLTGIDEVIDVAIVEQAIAPILKQRESDGTFQFDCFGGVQSRKITSPDELLMICIDNSRSMDLPTKFLEARNIEESVHENGCNGDKSGEDSNDGPDEPLALNEVRSLVLKHESFRDMIGMLQDIGNDSRRPLARSIVNLLRNHADRERLHWKEKLTRAKECRNPTAQHERRVRECSRFLTGLEAHSEAVCDLLMLQASHLHKSNQDWTYKLDCPISQMPSSGNDSQFTQEVHATYSGSSSNMVLVKVYSNKHRDHALFSFWLSQDAESTPISILFKYWRFMVKTHGYTNIGDRSIWGDMFYAGDDRFYGTQLYDWEPLRKRLQWLAPTGHTGDEPLCKIPHRFAGQTRKRSSDDTPESEDVGAENETSSFVKVMKVSVGGIPTNDQEKARTDLSRLDVLKQIFETFTNRILAYNYQTQIGLITFNTTPELTQKLTPVIEDFRHRINGIRAGGDTSLWDALALANDHLRQYAQKFPTARRRVLCISDGVDNISSSRAHEGDGIVVDSFCLGNDDNVDLRTTSYILGGYKFTPSSLEQAMSICEMEPVLCLEERPPLQRPAIRWTSPLPNFVNARSGAIPETVTRDKFPARKQHPSVNDQFVQLEGFARSSTARRSNANLRASRLLNEMKDVVAKPHPFYDVYVSESDMCFWKIVMQGPPDSVYANGTFVMYLDMDESYPAMAPKGRFLTPIYHQNVNRHGRICHSIFSRNWTSDTSMVTLLNTVFSLLLVPEFTDSANATMTLDYHHDEAQFCREVREHIEKHTTKSRAVWRVELTESA